MNELTQILNALEKGELAGTEQLFPIVYDELRRMAAAQLARELPGATLQPTALVNEAFLRLVDVQQQQRWKSRGHFFAAAAAAMRRILVDSARRKNSLKRGGPCVRVPLDAAQLQAPTDAAELLALDEALAKFTEHDPLAAQLIELRFFAGATMKQAAETLGISVRTAERLWKYGRTWLYRTIYGDA